MADSLVRGADSFASVSAFADDAAVDAAFTELYEANFSRVYSSVRAQVASSADAHEVVGRVFFKAYSHWRGAPRNEEAVLWLFKIARTTVIDYWRVEGRHEAARVSVDELAELPDGARDPETGYAVKEREALLLNVLNELDENNRMLLALKFTAHRDQP